MDCTPDATCCCSCSPLAPGATDSCERARSGGLSPERQSGVCGTLALREAGTLLWGVPGAPLVTREDEGAQDGGGDPDFVRDARRGRLRECPMGSLL